MKINTLLLIITIGLTASSCFDAPNYPDQPHIDFNYVQFKLGNFPDADSLIVSVDFEDGDGDVGLGPEESNYPFSNKIYFNKSGQRFDPQFDVLPDELATFSDADDLGLPPYSGDFICLNYDINPTLRRIDGVEVQVNDTVYYEFNQRYNNFIIQLQIKENGEFRDYNERTELECSTTFSGRFPILSDDLSKPSPLEGSIRYAIAEIAFNDKFQSETLRLRVFIYDREGNPSNVVESPEFTLQDIRVN
ncbi:hypothetical protein [Fulvivirga ligni]|uniref:hypothetical protein n=1 Tax=Fulvivirga ligni TaxID=2904246 RepID=UPI001F2A488F|nr:hypothetical protein [Fulvivirga ligni]UII23691.1 hypothetical protein LVD16_10685 [Fulvivirga ligni]